MSHMENIKFYKTFKTIVKNLINTLSGFDRKQAYKKYSKGMALYNKGEFAEAIEYFKYLIERKIISGTMEHDLAQFYYSQTHRNLGIIAFSKGNNKKALYHFKTALKFNPEHSDLNYFIGICLNNTGDFQGAVEAFKKLQAIDPDNVPNKLKLAIIFYNLGMWENAEKIQRKILEKNSGYADVHYYLGLSLICQGKVAESIESFSRALDINPGYINARLQLGIAQACLGKFDDAFTNLNTIIKQHPDYADVYYFIGLIHDEIGETKNAIKSFSKAIDLNSNFAKARLKLIITYCKTGEIKIAKQLTKEFFILYKDDENIKKLACLEKQISKITELPLSTQDDIPYNYSSIFEKEALHSQLHSEFHKNLHIIPSFSEIISLFTNFRYARQESEIPKVMIPLISEHIHKNPTYPDLYNSLGLQYLFIGEPDKAEIAFTKAVDLNPGYVSARINLLKTLHKNGKYREAHKHGKILLSANISFPDVYYTIAENLLALEHYDEALKNAEKILEIRPSFNIAHLLMANIHEKRKEYELAIQEIKKFLEKNKNAGLADKAKKMLGQLKDKIPNK